MKKEILKLKHYNAQLRIGLSESESLVQELQNEISVQLLRQANKDWAIKILETRIKNLLEKDNDNRNAIMDKIPDKKMEIIHPAPIIGDILKSVSSETNITSAPMENTITSNNHQTISYQQQETKCYP